MMSSTKAPHPIKRFYSTMGRKHSFPAKQSSPLIISTTTSPLRTRPRHVSITTTTATEIIDPPIQDDTVTAFWDYQFLFASQRSEALEPIVLRVVDGVIPSDFPSGTYYLTGPGIFSDDYGSTVHPLDGHGYLRAFSLDGSTGEVRFLARYVETEAQKEERDLETGRWRFTHRGPFSVLREGKKVGNTKVMKNVANTSVVEWGGRLLCLWEGGDPYEVEAETLDTVGRFEVGTKSVGGYLEEEGSGGGGIWDFAARALRPILFGVFKMTPKRLLSHYKIDPKRNRLLLVSCNAEDMLLPRSIFTFHGKHIFGYYMKSRNRDWSKCYQRAIGDPDLRLIIDYSLVEWKELGQEGPIGNEWEDRKIGRRNNFFVRRMELAKHFIRTKIEPVFE